MNNRYLFFLAVMIFLLGVKPVEAQGGPAVSIETSSQTLTVGSQWTLTLLIDCPTPDDVTVSLPSLTPFLSLDRLVKTPRVSGEQIQTVIEYRFIPNRNGRFTLGSFTVECPHGSTETTTLLLDISAPVNEQRMQTLGLIWEAPAGVITAGERVTIILRAHSRNSQPPGLPPPVFFKPEVPQGVILSTSSVTAEERAGGVVLKLVLIPLTAEDFTLPARVLLHDNTRYEIPSLNIRVVSRATM